MSYNDIMLNMIPTLYEGYIVSVHKMVMENRPVDPGNIQGSHRPISFMRIKHTAVVGHARTIIWIFFLVKLCSDNHIAGSVHKNHIINVEDWTYVNLVFVERA